MFQVIDQFTKYFTWDNIDVTNWNFKLYSKVSVAICMLAAATCICTEYFGNSIDCLEKEDKFVTQFCWLHGTYQFASEQRNFVEAVEKRTGQTCVTDEYYNKDDTVPKPAYYQWVVFMLFGHGCLFMLPEWIWKFAEGGLIENFVPLKKEKDGKGNEPGIYVTMADGGLIKEFSPVKKGDDGKGDELMKTAQKFNKLSETQNKLYFAGFVTCELMNIGVALVNFIVIDKFMNGKFLWYGYHVIQYLLNNEEDDYGDYGGSSATVNPMCASFPTLVNCEYFSGGVDGNLDVKSHICILSQNIVNEKIYLILWFWHIFLFGSSSMMLVYRCITTCIPYFRKCELYYRARKSSSKPVEDVSEHISLSQWFVLSQIGRNLSDSRQFNDFLKKIATDYKEEQKRNNKIGLNVPV